MPFEVRDSWLSFEDSGAGNIIRQISIILIFFWYLKVCVSVCGFGVLHLPVEVVVLYLYLIFSAIFISDYPLIAIRMLFVNFLILYFFLIATRFFGFDHTLKMVGIIFGFLMVISLILCWFPGAFHLGSDPEPSTIGAFRGIFYHKNTLGGYSSICIIVLAYLIFTEKFSRVLIFLLSVSFVCLLLSESVSSIFTTTVALFFMFFFFKVLIIRDRRFFIISGFLLLFFIFSFYVFSINFLDQDGMSGRVAIWSNVLLVFSEKPILGVGYASLFNVGDYTLLQYFADEQWLMDVASAHSGYVELLATTGVFGVLLILVIMLVSLNGIASNFFFSNYKIAVLLFVMFISFSMHNVLESSILVRSKPFWFLTCLYLSGVLGNSKRGGTL
jgi:O-antigen ligase